MKRLQALVFGVFLLNLGFSQGAPTKKRWIPERMSDNDYGLDTQSFPSGVSSDGYGSNAMSQPNYLSYWSDYYPGGYNGGDYSGMFYRANQDSNQGAMDPVQQLQNVQHYAYAQSLYPQGYPLPPPGPYQTDPSGRAMLAMTTMNSFPSSQSHQSANQALVLDRQHPFGFIMGMNNNPFLTPSMFSAAGHPQMFFVAPQTTQFQLPQSTENNAVKNSPQTISSLTVFEEVDTPATDELQSLQEKESTSQAAMLLNLLNNRQTGLTSSSTKQHNNNDLLQAALEEKINQEEETEQALKQDVEDTKELLETLKLANEMVQPSETKKEKIIIIMEESVDHAQTHGHSHNEDKGESAKQHSQKESQKHNRQKQSEIVDQEEESDLEESEVEDENNDDVERETDDQEENGHGQDESELEDQDEGTQQQSKKEHEKAGAQKHPNKEHEKTSAQKQSKKEHEQAGAQKHPNKEHEKAGAQKHPNKEHEKAGAQQPTPNENKKHPSKTSEKTKQKTQKAQGRAHESQDVYSTPNYEQSLYNASPLDLIYPGVMVPSQNRPTIPSYYYPPPQYGGGDQQYSPQTIPSTYGNSYYGTQYANPYMASQLGSYAASASTPPYQSYQVPITSPSSLSPYSSYYYPPRVARNSAAPTPLVRYVYGGKLFPQVG